MEMEHMCSTQQTRLILCKPNERTNATNATNSQTRKPPAETSIKNGVKLEAKKRSGLYSRGDDGNESVVHQEVSDGNNNQQHSAQQQLSNLDKQVVLSKCIPKPQRNQRK